MYLRCQNEFSFLEHKTKKCWLKMHLTSIQYSSEKNSLRISPKWQKEILRMYRCLFHLLLLTSCKEKKTWVLSCVLMNLFQMLVVGHWEKEKRKVDIQWVIYQSHFRFYFFFLSILSPSDLDDWLTMSIVLSKRCSFD